MVKHFTWKFGDFCECFIHTFQCTYVMYSNILFFYSEQIIQRYSKFHMSSFDIMGTFKGHSIYNIFFLLLFLHNTYGTPEISDCGNLVGADSRETCGWTIGNHMYHLYRSIPNRLFNLGRPILTFRWDHTDDPGCLALVGWHENFHNTLLR